MFRTLRRRRERDLQDEIRFHLEQEAQLRRDAGEASDAADRAARRDFGSVVLVQEVTRSMWAWTSLERIVQDLRIAWRGLRRSPGYVVVVVATLALGIGATTALFTVVNAVLLRPLPLPEPDRLVMVWERTPLARSDGRTTNVVQTQNYLDWRERNRSFAAIAAFQQLPMNISGPADAEQLPGLRVTGEFFAVLGIAPMAGRVIGRGEDVPQTPATTVLTHRFWQERYGGNPGVIGQRVSVNGIPHEIVGVMPQGFAFPGVRAELFVPLQIDPALAPRDGRNFSTVARLRPGVTVAAAQKEMEAIAVDTARERPAFNTGWSATVVPLIEQTVGNIKRPLVVLFAAVLCVLLVACANIANLALMRATSRSREMTVRLALGAGRGRLVHQLMVESLLLAAIGGGLGFWLARAGAPLIVSMFPATFPLPRAAEIAVDWRVLLFTALASIGSAAAFGVAPAFQSRRRSLVDALQGGSRSVSGAHSRVRAALVVGQVAVAVVLVMAAGLMVKSLIQLYRVDLGFRPERVLTMRMVVMANPADREPPTAARRAMRVESILDRVRALPDVVAAGAISNLPLSGNDSGTSYYRADRPVPPPGQMPSAAVSVITPGYFRVMGMLLREGRDLEARDRSGAPLAAVVNRVFVQQTFPGEEPLGRHFKLFWSGGRPGELPDFEIVGVVDDSRHAVKTAPDARVFIPNAQAPNFFAAVVVRTNGDPLRVAASVRRAVQEVNPTQGVSNVATMQAVVSESVASPRIQTVLMTAFGALALIMACVGLYGVLAYSVEQRRRELGIRLALGAAPGSVQRLVLGEGLKLTTLGIVGGLAGGIALTRVLETLLYEVSPNDPAVLAAVAALLLTIAAAACYLPARRATRVDPAIVLRDE
jgi:putative ABC transport system permease protein